MRRLLLLLAPFAILGGLLAGSSNIGLASTAVSGSFTDKPYTATTPDSGSCGNNWALDLFTRSFVIHPQNLDGTWTVTEHFNGGHFITLGDGETGSFDSPGHCDGAGNTHLLREGIGGTFNGSFTITIATGHTYTGNQGCSSDETTSGATVDDGCTAAQWIFNAFGATYPSSDAQVTAYSLTYKAVGKGLLGSTWTDSSSGDSGDIYTSVS
jgi:hypothetical protein